MDQPLLDIRPAPEPDDATEPTYQEPEIVALGKVVELTKNSNSGPFTDGSSDNTYRWKAG